LAIRSLAVGLLTYAGAASATVFYKFRVVADTSLGGFAGVGTGPSINDKGKVAFVGNFTDGPSIMVWDPTNGVTDLASNFRSPNRSFGEAVKINKNDEIVTWNRLLPLGLYEVRVFRAASPNDSSIAVRGLTDSGPYQLLYPNPAINNNKVLEDCLQGLPGNKDGVCDPGEVCLSQIAFNAWQDVPSWYLGTVVRTPIDAMDPGQQNQYGMNTSQSYPAMADDGRIVIRGRNSTDPILLFNYTLGAPSVVADSTKGFTALGAAPGITPDGKVIAFAGNRGKGDGVFLSIDNGTGVRRVVRIVGENAVTQKSELGVDGAGGKLCFSSIDLDSRVGVVYTPDTDGVADQSIVVSFIGTPNAASRINPGTGRPFLFSAQKGLWTIRIDLGAPLFMNIGVVQAPGATGNSFTPLGDDQIVVTNGFTFVSAGKDGICETENTDQTETLFSRSSPIPVVQIGDKIKGATLHTVSDIAVYDPVAQANYDDGLAPRVARSGDHRVVFFASVDGGTNQMIVAGEQLDSDQDGLFDHWETEGIDLDGTGNIDLDLPAMGANPFKRDFFIQVDWAIDRTNDPVAIRGKHQPAPGVMRKLAEFYAAAPATRGGVAAGIQLHVDAGAGFDAAGQYLSRNMGIGPLRGGNIVTATNSQPIDVLYFRGSGVLKAAGVTTVDFDDLKASVFWNHDRGAREFAFTHVVVADFHHTMGASGVSDNTNPIVGTATGGSPFRLEDANNLFFTDDLLQLGGNAIKITAGTGAGQVRRIRDSNQYPASGIGFVDVNDAWVTPPDATSQYIILYGSGGQGNVGHRYDGAFSPGKNLAITLAGFPLGQPGNTIGSFVDQWKAFAHEIGHLTTLKHGGSDHEKYKPDYVSLMNYAYEFCVAPNFGTGPDNTVLAGAAPCPVNDYSSSTDAVFDDWRGADLRAAVNFKTFGNAFGASSDPVVSPYDDVPIGRTVKEIEDQNGPIDRQAPTVLIAAPAGGATYALGDMISVSFTATDNVAVVRAEVAFDVNGDGVVDDATEVFPAVPGPGSTYTAFIPAISGPSGSRPVSVVAYDSSGNPGGAFVIVNVGSVPAGTVPNVVGQSEETATTAIQEALFGVGAITRQQSPSVTAGSVISQSPVGNSSAPPGTNVSLVISMGATGAIVPNVVGLSQSAATAAITGAGLTVGTITEDLSQPSLTPGVIAQAPTSGAVAPAGSPVSLYVMAVTSAVAVPNVVGLTLDAATTAIAGAGLVVGTMTTQESETVPLDSVISQNPTSGTQAATGSAVALVVSVGSPCPNLDWLLGSVNGQMLVTLSWSTNAVGFTLQSTFDLSPPVTWIDSTNTPVVIGTQFTATITGSGRSQFYRLRKP
jgi:beta-lactam-binding protein with PASTA domain